ncbi:helicase SRCAP isoform X2 [Anguilla anguilla]|uniref:helicase SRCAP isoform X2 n=1 Tax=Anguilla anguilla TaxID=7936 RepID=UPI0015AEEAAC|nr:helicase SRCAP isoform X2 [Anguilla anguilla]
MDHSQTTSPDQSTEPSSLPQSGSKEGEIFGPIIENLSPSFSDSDSLQVKHTESTFRTHSLDCSEREKRTIQGEVDGVEDLSPKAVQEGSEQFTEETECELLGIGEQSLCSTYHLQPEGVCTERTPSPLQAKIHGTPKPGDFTFKPHGLPGNPFPCDTADNGEKESSSQGACFPPLPVGRDRIYEESEKDQSILSIASGNTVQANLLETRTSSPANVLQNAMDVAVQLDVSYLREAPEPGLQEHPVLVEKAESVLSEQEFCNQNIVVSDLVGPSGSHETVTANQALKCIECPEVELKQSCVAEKALLSNAATVEKEMLPDTAGELRLERVAASSMRERVVNPQGGTQDSGIFCLEEMGRENHASIVQSLPSPHNLQKIGRIPKTPEKSQTGAQLDSQQLSHPQTGNVNNDSCTQLENSPPQPHHNLSLSDDGPNVVENVISCPLSLPVTKNSDGQGEPQDPANKNKIELLEDLTELNVTQTSLNPSMCTQTIIPLGQLSRGDEQLGENETKEHADKSGLPVTVVAKGSSLQTGLGALPIKSIDIWAATVTADHTETNTSPDTLQRVSCIQPISPDKRMMEASKTPLTNVTLGHAYSPGEGGRKSILSPLVSVSVEGSQSHTTSLPDEVSKGLGSSLQSERLPHAELPVSFQGSMQDSGCPSFPVLTDSSVLAAKVATMEAGKDQEPPVIQITEDMHEAISYDHAISSGVDPKLLILNLSDTPLDRCPPTILGGLSSNLEALCLPTTQASSSVCESGRVSVECLPKSGLPTDSVPEVLTDPSNHSEPASLCFTPVQNPLSLASSTLRLPQSESEFEALDEVKASPESTCTLSENQDITTLAAAVTPLSVTPLPLSDRNILSNVQTNLGYHTMPSKDSESTHLFTDVLELEQCERLPVPQLSISVTQSPTPERECTNRSENSDSETELAGTSQASGSNFATPSSAENKVCRWIADRILANSPLPPAPSPSTWVSTQIDRAFAPLRGPHGKFISPPTRGPGGPQQSDPAYTTRPRPERHTDMAELAKHEAEIEHRSLALKREGFWSLKRLSRVAEPGRTKVHWDYLCEEMQWLSADFAQERRWKRGVARKVVRMVMRHHEEQRQKEEKAKREEQAKLRRVASSIAKEVRAFWSSVEKVVQFKQQSRLEEKRKKALDLQLDFIVGQTERYSDLLSQSLSEANVVAPPIATPLTSPEAASSGPKGIQHHLQDEDDGDFEPPCEEEDDEETIEVEEQQEGNDAETRRREIELLRHEGTLPLDQLLHTLTQSQDVPAEDDSSESSISGAEEEEDEEFTANEDDAEDEEETIAAQEVVEGGADHSELGDLAREGEMSLDELLEKYRGAYSDDFEMPSASVSPTSSEEESVTSGDVEEDSDGDHSSRQSSSSSDGSETVESDDEGGEGMEILLKGGERSPPGPAAARPKEISHIAATAESLQPKGYTLATTQVKTPIPFLLHGTLREYQHIGLDWLVTMYEKKLNGILADEMGLGKTIQTIALLAHLACEKGNWGPHLIIVPTSVMLNWEMELKRWCPGFKILTYYGSQKERKLKRQGWTKPNAFHVCITSYKLVLQDHQAFRRKSWRYLILDEAQNIKNFKSQRWQSLLNFNSQRRLLLTGTPLQNSLMELWSLMHFLMPHVFQSHREFKEWFSNPLTGMIEGSQEYNEGLVKRLHKVLRPFLLRRIKADVEKQMPKKYEHVVRCRLSKRQRFLYDDFMAQASTRETLASGHFMSVINILMQLRKVCNHPDLFDPRPIHSPFITAPILFCTASIVLQALEKSAFKCCDLSMFDLVDLERRVSRYQADVFLPRRKVTPRLVQEIMDSPDPPPRPKPVRMKVNRMFQPLPKTDGRTVLLVNSPRPPGPDLGASLAPRPPVRLDTVPSATAVQPAPQVAVSTVAATTLPPPPVPLSIPASVTMCAGSGAPVRQGPPVPVMCVRPPAASGASPSPAFSPPPSSAMTQRVLLSPDMQARLPSGEVVSIAQLASLAGRPVSSCQGSKPVTFQLQGNKLTLSGAQLHQVAMAQPRPVQVPSSVVTSPGIVKIVVRQSTGKEGGAVSSLAVPPPPRLPTVPSPDTAPHVNISSSFRPSVTIQPPSSHTAPSGTTSAPTQTHLTRPVFRVLQGPAVGTEQASQAKQFDSPVSTEELKEAAASMQKGRVSTPSGREDNTDVITLRMAAPPNMGSFGVGHGFPRARTQPPPPPRSPFYMSWLANRRKLQRECRLNRILLVNERHCSAKPVYGREVLDFLTFLPCAAPSPPAPKNWGHAGHTNCLSAQTPTPGIYWTQSEALRAAIHSTEERLQLLSDIIDRYIFIVPPVEAPPITMHSCHPPPWLSHQQAAFSSTLSSKLAPLTQSLHRVQCNMRTHFPDLRLIQYDCGKLQTLHSLLRRLKGGGHRVLIFTQMTRMLDVLEQFLNYHGHIYLRLDGSTRVEQRQALMERFNADRRIFCFILSTRSGGVGVNLTGADTVVFYDSDWNPTMDAQAQDRCHRIGQTRDVHIYRLISERTVEENILKKANQKRMLGDMAIEGGNFTTAFFKQQTIRELFDVCEGEKKEVDVSLHPRPEEEDALSKQHTIILEQALCRAEDEEDIVAASQAKAEQVAELAEFNESIPFEEPGEAAVREQQQEEEELSKAEQEIAALVEQLTPIERYAMNFLEASLEDVCKEELKQAEEQVEAARKGLDQAKEEGLKLPLTSDSDDEESGPLPCAEETLHPTPNRRPRKHKEKGAPSTRASGRLRGATTTPVEDPKLTPTRVRAEDTGKGTEEVNLNKDLPSAFLAQSAHVPQQHRVDPGCVKLKKDNPMPQPVMREVPDSSYCALQGRDTTKDFSASTNHSPVHIEKAQTMSPFPMVLEPTNLGWVCPSSGSDLMPGSQSAPFPASPLHLPSLVPSTAFTPATVIFHTIQAPLASPCHSLSDEEGKDQLEGIQSDSSKVSMEAILQSPIVNDKKQHGDFKGTVLTASSLIQTPVGSPKPQCVSAHTQHYDSGTQHTNNPAHEQLTPHLVTLPSHPVVLSTLARSPRKRQSADGEVLSGLPEDSPSAKVLRKLPGRLVTVVEDKEPKKRKRRVSGGGGSSTGKPDGSAQTSKSVNELSRGTVPPTPDRPSSSQKENKVTGQMSPSKISPLLQLSQNSPSAYPSRAGVISPYSPTHHSPDMPVLRNLPVRRRLETESRMAAQLGEQQPGRGRGRGERRTSLSPNFPRKKDIKLEGSKDSMSSLQTCNYVIPNVNTTSPGKRKRGRPPKMPHRVTDSPTELPSSALIMEVERTGSVEGSPSSSPKRKRGRPRKGSLKVSEPIWMGKVDLDPVSSPAACPLSPHSDRATPTTEVHSCSSTLNSACTQLDGSAATLLTSCPTQGAIKNEAELVKAEEEDQGGKDTETASEEEVHERTQNRESTKQKDTVENEKEGKEVEGFCEQGGSSQPNKRVVTCISGSQELDPHSPTPSPSFAVNQTTLEIEGAGNQEKEDRNRPEENRNTDQKRLSSRQSSQDSARSSSPSSVSSNSTSTCLPLSIKEEACVAPMKRKQEHVNAEREKGDNMEGVPCFLHARHSESACPPMPFPIPQQQSLSSDSDESCGDIKEQRLTRASQKKLEQAEEIGEMESDKDANNRRKKRSASTPDRGARDKPGSNVSARATRKSLGPQPSPECTPQSPAVPEVLGKRCSALNAAAKLLAMRGRGNEGSSSHGGRGLDAGLRGVGQIRAPEWRNKPWGRVSQEPNSCTNKAESSRQAPTTTSRTARSTRQRPGCLVPPLEMENKRAKKPAKKAAKKEAEGRCSVSPQGQSTSSSTSSEGGEGSSRSRSSSVSSQRTHSFSSQSTGPLFSHSRAASSCSDQERGQESRDQPGKKRNPRERADRDRKSRKEKWRHQERDSPTLLQSRGPELSIGSSEGTPDRVLRSVAALAAAQARTPASNTRSSSNHHHQQQTHVRRTKT